MDTTPKAEEGNEKRTDNTEEMQWQIERNIGNQQKDWSDHQENRQWPTGMNKGIKAEADKFELLKKTQKTSGYRYEHKSNHHPRVGENANYVD